MGSSSYRWALYTLCCMYRNRKYKIQTWITLSFFILSFFKHFSLLLCYCLVFDFKIMVCKCMSYYDLVCRDFPYNLIANILVSLTLKDTRAGLKFLLGTEGVERWGPFINWFFFVIIVNMQPVTFMLHWYQLPLSSLHLMPCHFGIKNNSVFNDLFLKCLFSRTNLIQCQRQPGGDREAVLAVQLQHAALSDASDWRVSEGRFNRRPIRCRPRPQKQVGAIPALCGRQPTQLLLPWCEWKLIFVCLCLCVCSRHSDRYLFWSPLRSLSPPLQSVWCAVPVCWRVF